MVLINLLIKHLQKVAYALTGKFNSKCVRIRSRYYNKQLRR